MRGSLVVIGEIHKCAKTELSHWWPWRAEDHEKLRKAEAPSCTASPWPQEDAHPKLRGSDLQLCVYSLDSQAFSNGLLRTFSKWRLNILLPQSLNITSNISNRIWKSPPADSDAHLSWGTTVNCSTHLDSQGFWVISPLRRPLAPGPVSIHRKTDRRASPREFHSYCRKKRQPMPSAFCGSCLNHWVSWAECVHTLLLLIRFPNFVLSVATSPFSCHMHLFLVLLFIIFFCLTPCSRTDLCLF